MGFSASASASRSSVGQSELLEIGAIRRLLDERPTYGYRRIAALLNSERQSSSQAPVNTKRIYRLMKKHGLLLERRTGHWLSREYDEQVATIYSNCRRTRCFRPRHPGRDIREMILEMMVQCVERRLAASPVEWLSGNGLIFAADPTPRNARIEVTGLSETAVRCCGSRLTKLRHDATGSTAKLVRPLERGHFGTDGAKEREPSRRYLLISPCRDEAQYLRGTLDSVAAQSVPPALWVVVDDGSTDATAAILEAYARRLPYLRVVRRTDRGRREVGPGVIEAFYAGLEAVRPEDFNYLCKLDLDLHLPVRYFELLMQRMESDPRVGTTSGKPWFVHPQSGALVPEICGDEMSAGMTKFYRVACFNEIGGFVRQVMWDGIDCHRARMLGWIAESLDLEPLRFVHLRPQGTSQNGIWTGRLRAGFGQYFMGTSPLYYIAAALHRLPTHPVLIGSVALLWGYFRSWLKGLPRYDDLEFRRFLRSYQHACLRIGKRAATARVDAERAHLWYASHPAPESRCAVDEEH